MHPHRSSDRRFLMLLLLISLLAGGLRTAWVLSHRELLTVDVDGYLDIARHLTAGSGYSAGNPPYHTAFRPPLYPCLVALALLLPGNVGTLALFQVLMGMATVALVGSTARRIGVSTLYSLVAALIVALDPVLIHVSATPMTETFCTFLIAIWASVAVSQSAYRHWTAGLLLGLLALCRPTFLPFIGLQIFALLMYAVLARFFSRSPSPSSGDFRPLFRVTVLQLLCIVLCLLPWFIRNGLVVGKWTPATTHGGYTILLGNNETFYREVLHAPWGTSWSGESLLPWQRRIEDQMHAEDPTLNTEPERDAWFYRLALRTIQSHPGDFLYSCLWRFGRLWDLLPQSPLRDSIPVPLRWVMVLWFSLLWFGMLVGIVRILRQGVREQILLPLMILNVSVVHLFYWTDLRMRAPLIPLVAVLAALGWQRLFGDRANSARSRDGDQSP